MVANFVGRLALFLFRLGAYFLSVQPRSLQLFWGSLLGELLYRVKFRRRVVEENLARAFPKSQGPNVILRRSYHQFGNLILEILLLLGPFKKFVLKNTTLHGVEHIRAAEQRGRGIIFLGSHVGNWEIMAATAPLMAQTDLLLVTKRIQPAWLHEAIEKARLRYQVRATYEPRTLRDVLACLKKNGAVGFVLDQYAGPPVGVRVPLFGVPVGTSEIVAAMAKRTGAQVLPVVTYREPNGRFAVNIRPAVEWQDFSAESGGHFDLAANTARYTAIIEQDILGHPEQWLWTHRRFKGDLTPLHEREWNEARARR